MVARGENGEDDAECVLIAAHQGEQLPYFGLERLVHEDSIVNFSEDFAQSNVGGIVQSNDFSHMAYVISSLPLKERTICFFCLGSL